MTASLVYDSFVVDTLTGAVVPGSDTFYCMLVDGYTPNQATDAKRSDVAGEVVGTGYTAGGKAVSCAVAQGAGNTVTVTFGNPAAWTTSTITATGAVVYKHRGGAASADNLVGYIDFGGTVSSTGASFTATITSPITYQL